MELTDAIFCRKSVRSYTGEMISEADLKAILHAGAAAPAGMGRFENLHMTVIEKKELLEQIVATCARISGNPDANPIYGAPVLVLISAAPAGDALGNVEYSDAAMIAHNMALAATERGVGSCYIWGAIRSVNQDPDLLRRFRLPEGFTPCCALTLGVTTETYPRRDIPTDRIGTDTIR